MGKLKSVIFLIVFFGILTGCEKKDYDIPEQQTKFENFFTNRGWTEQTDKYAEINGVYRFIWDEFDPVGKVATNLLSVSTGLFTSMETLEKNMEDYIAAFSRLNLLASSLEAYATVVEDSRQLLDYYAVTNKNEIFKELPVIQNQLDNSSKDIQSMYDWLKKTDEENEEQPGEEMNPEWLSESDEEEEPKEWTPEEIKETLGSIIEESFFSAEVLEAIGTDLAANSDHYYNRGLQTVETGDIVNMYYRLHYFNSSHVQGLGAIIATNMEEYIEGADFDPEIWKSDILNFEVGDGGNLKGLNIGLPGCKDAQVILLFLTSDLAYDNKIVGTIPEGTPVVFYLEIESITKKN